MLGLKEDSRTNSIKRFVGRNHELNMIKSWMDDSAAPFRIFAISGMGGIGKSALMAEMMRYARGRNTLGIWIDGASCMPTPFEFLKSLSVSISLETLDMQFTYSLEPLMKANPEHRVILCIDNFDNLSMLEGWLQKAFLPRLPWNGVAVILTSRPELSMTWKMNISLYGIITEMPLTYLSEKDTASYIQSAVPFHQDFTGGIVRASEGYPLALAMAVDSVLKSNGKSGPDLMALSQTISAHILKEITSPEQQKAIDALTVLRHANQEMLSLMLEEPVTLVQYQMLKGISFIQPGPEGLILHDLVRLYLLRDFRIREPNRLNKLRIKAAAILNKQLLAPSAGITEKEVRKILSSLHSPAMLQAFLPLFIGEENGLMLQNHLLSLLTDVASEILEQDRKILYYTYYTHANNRIAAMQACSMSRATFYRHLNKAIMNFTEMLKGKKVSTFNHEHKL